MGYSKTLHSNRTTLFYRHAYTDYTGDTGECPVLWDPVRAISVYSDLWPLHHQGSQFRVSTYKFPGQLHTFQLPLDTSQRGRQAFSRPDPIRWNPTASSSKRLLQVLNSATAETSKNSYTVHRLQQPQRLWNSPWWAKNNFSRALNYLSPAQSPSGHYPPGIG